MTPVKLSKVTQEPLTQLIVTLPTQKGIVIVKYFGISNVHCSQSAVALCNRHFGYFDNIPSKTCILNITNFNVISSLPHLHPPQASRTYILYVMDNIRVFPNCFHWIAEFSDKNIFHNSKRTRTCHLLCKRPWGYHSTSKTHVKDRIFKLSPIHGSVIYQIPWIRWIHWKFCSI